MVFSVKLHLGLTFYPLSLFPYPLSPIAYPLSLIPYTLYLIPTPCSLSPSTVPFTKFRWGLSFSFLWFLWLSPAKVKSTPSPKTGVWQKFCLFLTPPPPSNRDAFLMACIFDKVVYDSFLRLGWFTVYIVLAVSSCVGWWVMGFVYVLVLGEIEVGGVDVIFIFHQTKIMVGWGWVGFVTTITIPFCT